MIVVQIRNLQKKKNKNNAECNSMKMMSLYYVCVQLCVFVMHVQLAVCSAECCAADNQPVEDHQQ